MDLKTEALRATILKAVADALKAEVDAGRADLLDELRNLYDQLGTKSLDVRLPDGTKVASISLAIPKGGAAVSDQVALDAWIIEHFPTAVVVVPERKIIADAYRDKVLAEVTFTADGRAITAEGEEVPGIEYRDGGDPRSFSIRYEKQGREAIAAAWSDGQFGSIMPGIAPDTLALPGALE